MIKVVMIVLFIIVGLIYDWSGIKGHPGPVSPFPFIHRLNFQSKSFYFILEGLLNFKNGQAFIGGFSAFSTNLIYALYSFGGVELVAVTAGESSKPYSSVPRDIRATIFRIVLFYIVTILTIGLCINHADLTLLNANSNSKYLRFFFFFLFNVRNAY